MGKKNKPHVRTVPNTVPPYQRPGTIPGARLPYQAKPYKPYVAPKPKLGLASYLVDVSKPIIPPSPEIQYTYKAWDRMRWLVLNCPTELGWVGAIEKVNNMLYVIHDVRVMEQQGASTTFEYDDWNDAVTEMIMSGTLSPGRVDANLGHSHVNMGVSPSGVDAEQMMDLLHMDEDGITPSRKEDGTLVTKFTIQTIHNKQGDSHGSVYDWENKKYYPKCAVTVQSSLTEEEIADLTDQLTRVKPYTYGSGFAEGYAYGGRNNDFYGYHAGAGSSVYKGNVTSREGVAGTQASLLDSDLVSKNDVQQHEYVVEMEHWSEAQWVLWSLGYYEEDITSGLAAKTEALTPSSDIIDVTNVETITGAVK